MKNENITWHFLNEPFIIFKKLIFFVFLNLTKNMGHEALVTAGVSQMINLERFLNLEIRKLYCIFIKLHALTSSRASYMHEKQNFISFL